MKENRKKLKERIFIAWSGKSKLANKVSALLENNDYVGIVGGDQTVNPDSLYVGPSIIKQMNQCSQAILIITKKDVQTNNQSVLSNNLYFEFGYLVAQLSNTKIHVYYIDIDENDPLIPSDLKGGWAKYLICENDDISKLAQDIVEDFLESQHEIILEEKMDIVLRWYRYKQIIRSYLDNPTHSNFELAQYLLFYIQAVFFFDDYDESIFLLQKLKDSTNQFSYELRCSIDCALLVLEFYRKIKSEKLDVKSFDCFIDSMETNLRKERDFSETEFKSWYQAIHYENMGFAYYLIITGSAGVIDNDIEDTINEMLNICFKALDICEKLSFWIEKEKNLESIGTDISKNYYFSVLYKAYIYRQIAIAYQIALQKEIPLRNINIDICQNAINNSFAMRKILYDRYNCSHINELLKSNFEMEYYIAMSETIQDKDETREGKRRVRMLKSYIERVKQKNLLNKDIISRIENTIKEEIQ